MKIDAELLVRFVESSGGCGVAVRAGRPADLVDTALESARRAALEVRHPEEPEDSFVSFVGPVVALRAGPGFVIDAKDVGSYEEVGGAVIESIVAALGRAGIVSGTLTAGDRPARKSRESGDRLRLRDASVRTSGASTGLPARVWCAGASPRPDGRSDMDLYRVEHGELERLTIGHFVFGFAASARGILVSELKPDFRDVVVTGPSVPDSRSCRLWLVDDNQLHPLLGLNNPECGGFDESPNGRLLWTSGSTSGVGWQSTRLSLWSDGHIDAIDETSGEEGDGNYLWAPCVDDDGTVAYLRGDARQAKIVVRRGSGEQTQYTMPRGLHAMDLRLSPDGNLAVSYRSNRIDDPPCVAIVEREHQSLLPVAGWRLARPGTRDGGFLIHRPVAPSWETTDVALLRRSGDQLEVETLGHLPFGQIEALALP